ncbi:KilA-N domain-containing protein [Flavobacterium sp. ZS1P70]|uniref:KilA-N domain-containing protein n=1 Tax=Flavobacterium zhoui TaxID=3230414 RepID=A0ABW6I7D2_9FLAO
MKTLELYFQEQPIRFIVGKNDQVKVNGSDMAKIFNKKIQDFCDLKTTREFVKAYLESENVNPANSTLKRDDVIFNKPNFPVMLNNVLAIKAASWINSDLEIWIMKTIDDLKFEHYKAHLKAVSAHEEEKIQFEDLKNKAIKEQNELALLIIESHNRLDQFRNDSVSALKKKRRQVHNTLFTREEELK